MATHPAPVNAQATRLLSPLWGPFHGPGDALAHVGPFMDRTVGSSVGICWASGARLYPLRRPHYDANGFGEVVIVEWRTLQQPPPRPQASATFEGRMWAFLNRVLEQQGQAALLEGQIAQEQGRMMTGAFSTLWDRAFRKHASDTEGVAIDVLVMALSIGFFVPPFGALAFLGGLALIVMDGAIWGQEILGDDTRAEETRESTKVYRWAAAIACATDAVYGLGKVALELPKLAESLSELKAARASSEATAWRASTNSGRAGREAIAAESNSAAQAAKADFARRYAAIADRARQRAAAKAFELGRKWSELGRTALHEVTPRLLLGETFRLMYGDLTVNDKEEVLRVVRSYGFHVVSVHR